MNRGLSDKQIKETIAAIEDALRKGYRRGGSPSVGSIAAEALGVGGKAIPDRLKAMKNRGYEPDWTLEQTPKTQPISPATALEAQDKARLEGQVRDLQAQIDGIHRDNITSAIVRETILGLSTKEVKPPKWMAKPSHKTGAAGVPCTIWSDWHLGEVVLGPEINNVNQYDIAIAQSRVRRLVSRILDLCFVHSKTPDYPGIVVNLLGDIFSGNIIDELRRSNEMPIMPVFLEALGLLTWALQTLIDRFGNVFVACCHGNHGRLDQKRSYKKMAHENFDWLLCQLLDRHFVDDGRIQFSIPESGDCLYSVYGHRYMATHGDNLGTRGGDGIIGSLGPIIRGDFKVRDSSTQIDRDYDTLLMGHWHQYLPLDRVHVNGSLKGYDEFAKNHLRARFEAPRQALWFTHHQYGMIRREPVYVDEVVKPLPPDWLTFAAFWTKPKTPSPTERRHTVPHPLIMPE